MRINLDIVDQVASTFPGFISAAVHRSTDGTRVVNYLQWESADHLAAMQRSPEFQTIAGRFAGLVEFDPHECEVVQFGQRAWPVSGFACGTWLPRSPRRQTSADR